MIAEAILVPVVLNEEVVTPEFKTVVTRIVVPVINYPTTYCDPALSKYLDAMDDGRETWREVRQVRGGTDETQ